MFWSALGAMIAATSMSTPVASQIGQEAAGDDDGLAR